jgi:hypothetical protein
MKRCGAAGRRGRCRVISSIMACLVCSTPAPVPAQEGGADWETDIGGHTKYQFITTSFPDSSIFKALAGSSAQDHNGELRLKFSARRDHWDLKADYQFIAVYSDTLEMSRQLPGAPIPVNSVISDDRRWFDLTHVIENEGRRAVVHRLDRLSIGFTTRNSVWRFGRQAISWGNGMVFTPMDVFNPFDPAAVDKEYKTGDDMLYGQFLFGNGSDLQATAIVRRNPHNGDVESDQSSLAVKYHGFAGMNEYDLLAAQHYGDQIIGLGGIVDVGGAVLRGDITWTFTELDEVFSAVASVSYSWIWGGKNVSGLLEYYHNGFGQHGGAYAPADLAQNPDLLRRLERGELFTLGREYLAASLAVELTPLFVLTPNVFINLNDPSALAQFIGQYDWRQNLQVLIALSLPVGPDGSEYGGIDTGIERLYFSTGPSLFAQLAWYF